MFQSLTIGRRAMAKFTDLNNDRKRQFLVNSRALMVAMQCLAELTDRDRDLWIAEIWRQAYSSIAALPDEEINRFVEDFEREYVPFDEYGNALMFGNGNGKSEGGGS